MAEWASGLLVCVVGAALLTMAAGAWGQLAEQSPSCVLLSARQIADAKKAPPTLDAGGTYHAWAWQRAGADVKWTLAGHKMPPAAAAGDKDTFAWVKLGSADLPAGQPIAVNYSPAPKTPAHADVAALLLTREADCDPARLWQLTRAFPEGPRCAPDERIEQCRHLNMRFTMPEYPTKRAWEARADWLRRHIRVSCGLVPEPDRTPLKPRVFGKIDRDGYTIEKVFFESRPGFYVCGNLFRPRDKTGPLPAVACPHGHWGQGRFGHEEPSGSVPGRCITLARLGYVVLAYDMVGYNDSAKQVGKHRGVFTTPHNELWGLSMMHLQSWNTIRVIDFLQSLPDVDPKRIAVTGCSGGGTQTFMVMGIEPRVTVAAPVCMVSGIMQGGCECENAPLLRIETNNIEIAALMAPRPLIMPSATGDWTRETPKVELPSVRGIYELYGVADRVAGLHTKSGHGYNKQHREGVYTFFRRWMEGIDDGKHVDEPPFEPDKREDLLVFDGQPLPKDAKNPETLKAHIIADCRRQRDELLPAKADDRKRFDETLGEAYRHAILAELPKPGDLAIEKLGSASVGDVQVTRLLLGRKGAGDRVPALLYRLKGAAGKARPCVVVHPDGKAALIDAASARPGKILAALLADGRDVLAIDTYLTGEFLSPVSDVRQKVEGGFFSVYNRTALVQRVQDILTAVAYLGGRGKHPVDLVGLSQAGAWCVLAAPFTPETTRVAADLAQIAGDDDGRWLDDLFTPLILKAGALWTAAALAAPRDLFLHNAAEGFDTKPFRAAYRAADAAKALRLEPRPCGGDAIARWLSGEQ